MKTVKLALFQVTLSFVTAFSQTLLPMDRNAGNLPNELNLNDRQKAKIEKILKQKRNNIDRIRNKMMTIMENLRDSTEYVSNETEKEILKVLNKEQAEEYKSEIENSNQDALLPPAGVIGKGFPLFMPGPNQAVFNQLGPGKRAQDFVVHGRFGQDLPEQGCVEIQDDVWGPDTEDPNLQDDDTDSLHDFDIFDLLDIIE